MVSKVPGVSTRALPGAGRLYDETSPQMRATTGGALLKSDSFTTV